MPAGETRHPRTDLAFAMAMTVIGCTIIFTLVQIITMTMLPEASQSKTPVADAAAISRPCRRIDDRHRIARLHYRQRTGSLLTASRYLFAFAETDTIPRTFSVRASALSHPTHAIWFSTAVALALALTGSFVLLVAASAIARLLTYSGVSAAALVLRRAAAQDKVAPAAYVVPLVR